jgi:8-oxo-dGTP diphosphatase
VATRDGDGFVMCDCGRPHWGLHGAAGLLLVRDDLDTPQVLLQLRAGWTHDGGTWALPGGARDSHEGPAEAAMREAHEEAGIDESIVAVQQVFVDDHGNWSYATVIARTNSDAGAHEANHESTEVRWVPVDEVAGYELHPGLAATWPTILPLLTRPAAEGSPGR